MSAFHFYVKIKGKKQGAFKGESQTHDRGDWFQGVKLQFKSYVPLDPNKGVSTGMPRHEPLVVTKEWGAASPQILQAMWDGEVLDEVNLEFVAADTLGNPEVVYEQITLKNATIVSVERRTVLEGIDRSIVRREVEDVGIRYEEITVKNVSAHTVARHSAKD